MLGGDYGEYKRLCSALEEIATLKARIAELEKEREWRPIAEAPKARRGEEPIWLLLFVGTYVTIGAWFWHDAGNCGAWEGEYEGDYLEPTHFQLLPKGPKEAT